VCESDRHGRFTDARGPEEGDHLGPDRIGFR
jgi:hypothetical protein